MIRRIHAALDAVVLSVTIPLTLLMLGCTVWQVVSRYFLGVSTSFTDELARFLFIWVSLIGAAYVLGRRGHIAISGLILMLPAGPKRAVDLVIALLVVVFAVSIFGYGGFLLVNKALMLGQISPAIQIPVGYVYAVIPISGALTAVYALLVVAEVLLGEEEIGGEVSLD